MTLKAELRAMAHKALENIDWPKPGQSRLSIIESALHAAVKRVLEQEPSEAMLDDGQSSTAGPVARNVCRLVYRAMTTQLLREIEE